MGRPLELARAFMRAVEDRDADAAAALCAEDVEVLLPGAEQPLRGQDGVREIIRRGPAFLHSLRGEEEKGTTAHLRTLTRAPGVFANYTTWNVETDGERITRLTFDLRPAN